MVNFQVLYGILYVFILGVISVLSCNGFSSTDYNSTEVIPKMLVHSLSGKVKVTNSTVLVEEIGVEIGLDCWAPFPIDFEFHGHLTNRDVTVNIIKRVAPNYTDLSTYCFHINITVRSFEEITGEYSCFQVRNQSTKTGYYMYFVARPRETLLNRGQHITIEALPGEEWITIPCAVSNPDVTVYLYNDSNQTVPLSENIKYDPKAGFTLKVNRDLWGKYQCKTFLGTADMVEIQIHPPKRFLVDPTDQIIVLREGDILKLSCESVEDILIEPDIFIPVGRNTGRPRHDGSRRLKYLLDFESRVLKAGMSGRVICKTKAHNRTLFEWTYQVRESKTGLLKRTENFNAYLCNGGPTLTVFECSNWVECKMRKCQRKDKTCESQDCKNSQTIKCLPSGILQCYNKENQSVQEKIFFSGLQQNTSCINTNWPTASQQDILKIRKFVLNPTSSFTTAVVCEGSSFIFAVGFKWFVLTKLGNQLQISDDYVDHKWRHEKLKNIIKSTAKINISDDLSSIICKAPVWNSTKWIDDTLYLADMERAISSTSGSSHHISDVVCIEIFPVFSFIFILLRLK